jgi:hypothetical protein
MKTERLVVKEVVHIGDRSKLEHGVLYLSRRFNLAIHLCACGECRWETVTPLNEPGENSGWTFTEGPNGPTLYPSIGNQQFPCKSHYWVTDGKIVWCP